MSDIKIQVKEKLIDDIFQEQKKQVKIDESFPWSDGSFKVRGKVKAHLKEGEIRIVRAGTKSHLEIKELDIVWEDVRFQFGIDIPTVTIGGGCVLRAFGRCRIRLPRKSFFKKSIDMRTPEIRLPKFRSEISMSAYPIINKTDSSYKVFLKPTRPDIDFVDIPDTVGDALDSFVDLIVDDILGFLPRWARGLIKRILGNLTKLVRRLLDLGDDIEEWLSRVLNTSLGLFDIVADLLLAFFGPKFELFELNDPYPILQGTETLKPVMLNIKDLNLKLDVPEKELILNVEF
ncbi:hypothetical protein [Pseudoalteromonas sp.]|uniref:hypothetical protein n=1 Tax=Pseudoalteromonas sp. TaxID=53249 RepID=UPI0030028209